MPRFLLCLLLASTACHGKGPAPSRPLLLVDDAGDTLRLSAPARRIVSLIPATTEWLFAIGAGEYLVGRTRWDDYPSEALTIADVGDGIAPNLEAILARGPDLVLLYPSPQNGEAAGRLRDLGVGVLQLRTDLLGDMVRHLALLGDATGQRRVADSVITVFRRALDAATVAPAADAPTVFLLAWDQPPMTLGRGSYLSELVERAGGRNLFSDLGPSSGTVSLEAVVARDPDLILITAEGPPRISARPEWRTLAAVRDERFLRVTGSEFSRPSPRAPSAIRQLAEGLRAWRASQVRP